MQKLADSIQTELHKAQSSMSCVIRVGDLLREAQAQVHAALPAGSSPRASASVAALMPYFSDTRHTLPEKTTFYLSEAQIRVFSNRELSAIAECLFSNHEVALVMLGHRCQPNGATATDDCEVIAEHTADQIKTLQEAGHDLKAAQTCYDALMADSRTASAQVWRLTNLLGSTKAAHAEVVQAQALLDKTKAAHTKVVQAQILLDRTKAAHAEVVQARALLDKAQADLDSILGRAGLPDQAQSLLDKAQADLDRVGLPDQAQALLEKARAEQARVGFPDQAQNLLDTAQADLTHTSAASRRALQSLRTAERRFAQVEETYNSEGARAAKRPKGSGGAH